MPYKLRILSPLHIGCGESYSSLNFIVDRGRYYYIDEGVFFKFLGEKRVPHFVNWIEENTKEIEQIGKDISFLWKQRNSKGDLDNARKKEREIKRRFTLYNYTQKEKLDLDTLIAKCSYSGTVQGQVFNDFEIKPFIKQMYRPFIPGSEIKGAIRTAVLYRQLSDTPDLIKYLKNKLIRFSQEYADELDNVKRSQNRPDKIKNKLVKKMGVIESAFQEEVFNSVRGDAKYDVMKYLAVGDSELMDANKVLAVSYLEPFNTSKKFRIYNEFMKPENTVSLTALGIESNNSRTQKMEKMGFTDCQKQIVVGMDFIQEACFRFSSELLQEEIDYFKRQSKPRLVQHLEGLASQNSKASPIFRIGKDEGFNSLTVGMAIKKMAPDLYSKVLIHATKGKSYESEFPKSRKIIQWNGKELTAGWVQLVHDDGPPLHQSNREIVNKKIPQKDTEKLDLSGLKNKFGGKGRK